MSRLKHSQLTIFYFSESLSLFKFLDQVEQANAYLKTLTCRFSAPYVKSLHINVISQQKIQNET